MSWDPLPPKRPCDLCGLPCRSPLKRRVICQACYRTEMRSKAAQSAKNPAGQKRIFPIGRCEVCGEPCKSVLIGRVMCRECHRSRASAVCPRCERRTQEPDSTTGLCPRCTAVTLRPRGECTRCQRHTSIYNLDAWLCHTCHHTISYLKRCNAAKSVKIRCRVCGQLRRPELLTDTICRACRMRERHEPSICPHCRQPKVIYSVRLQACKQCYKRLRAPELLRHYITQYETPFPFNRWLFDLLVDTLDWTTVDETVYRRVRYFGRYLEGVAVDNPLTWEAIERLMPPLGPTNRNIPKQIRACLLAVGHLAAAQGLLETREVYLERKRVISTLRRSPAHLQPLLEEYATWLWQRHYVPAHILDHFEVLAAFWSWAVSRGIQDPAAVQADIMNEYLLTLYWEWACTVCGGRTPFEAYKRSGPRRCPLCHAVGTLQRERRYAQNTIRSQRAKLYVFFTWARANHLIAYNPVQRRTPAPDPTIHHYSADVVRELCAYIGSEDADPREAIALFLILFHGLTVWELCHAKVPQVLALNDGSQTVSLADAYYVIVPRPAPSKGDRSPGRPSTRVQFPEAARPWLAPLLTRYDYRRRDQLAERKNEYLFVTPLRHNVPASGSFITNLVTQATLRILGGSCNPNTLRKTCGVLMSERGGGAVLCELGWEANQAFAYLWVPRVTVSPSIKSQRDENVLTLPDGDSPFPEPCEP